MFSQTWLPIADKHAKSGQYPDGLRGPIIVNDPYSPYKGQYDAEIVVTVSDWYHDQMPGLVSYYLDHTANGDGSEPIPYSALLNDAQDIKLNVQPGKTYFIRTINMAAFAQAYIHFDQVRKLHKQSNQGTYWLQSTTSPLSKSTESTRIRRKSKPSILLLHKDTVFF